MRYVSVLKKNLSNGINGYSCIYYFVVLMSIYLTVSKVSKIQLFEKTQKSIKYLRFRKPHFYGKSVC